MGADDDTAVEGHTSPEVRKSKTSVARLEASQAERLVVAVEDQADKTEAIFNILNSPGLWGKIVNGLIGTFDKVMNNITKEGSYKYTAGVLLGLAGIANGVAFSVGGFSASGELRCGPGTVEDDGWCVILKDDGSSTLDTEEAAEEGG